MAIQRSLDVIVFPGGFNWPIWAAQENNFFADLGIEVRLVSTPDSVFQMTGLIEGRYHVAMTAMDNVIAYAEGQGASKTPADLVAVMGVDSGFGFLRLVARPDIERVDDLRGKRVSVDAPTTGYSFVLRKLLSLNGLAVGEYQLVSAGGMRERFQALLSGAHACTLLAPPFDMLARERGFHLLTDATEKLGAYQGVVAALRRDWATANRAAVQNFISGYLKAIDWLVQPANRGAAVELLARSAQLEPGLADKSYDVLLHPDNGFARDGTLNQAGIERVLALRSEFGAAEVQLGPSERYCEGSFHHAVARERKANATTLAESSNGN
jgi:ABC-type nitrate/sulfonate/bicarbonate transport system substrate-binding protein